MRRPEQRRSVPGVGKQGCPVPGSDFRPRSWQRQTRLIGMFSSPLASCGVDAAGGSGGALRCGGGQGNGWGCWQYSTYVLSCANIVISPANIDTKQVPLAPSPTRWAEPEATLRFYHSIQKTMQRNRTHVCFLPQISYPILCSRHGICCSQRQSVNLPKKTPKT